MGSRVLFTRIHSFKHYFFFFNDTPTTEISPLPHHDALPISRTTGGRTTSTPSPARSSKGSTGSTPRTTTSSVTPGSSSGTCRPAESPPAAAGGLRPPPPGVGRGHL